MRDKRRMLSHDAIQRALQRFQKHGGLIQKLPDERAPSGTLVGAKFAAFEFPGDPTQAPGEGPLEMEPLN